MYHSFAGEMNVRKAIIITGWEGLYDEFCWKRANFSVENAATDKINEPGQWRGLIIVGGDMKASQRHR